VRDPRRHPDEAKTTSRRYLAPAVGLALLALGAGACAEASGEGSAVQVSMKDYELTVSPDTAPAGTITLEASSDGPSVHEFEVFEVTGDVDPGALPVEDDVAITDGLTLIDEVEDVVPGSTAELTLELEPGTYAIVCNLAGHYAKGMHATLTVT
jgi:uncharacterized cupredoxin-like copper-binding protein